jgi:hypothetical protein
MTHISVLVVAHAIMSLIPMRKRPPVSEEKKSPSISKIRILNQKGDERTVVNHGDILFLRRTCQRIAPEQLETLSAVKRK